MANTGNSLQKLIQAGVCDKRGCAIVATAEKLPDYYGMVMLGVKGSLLQVFDTNLKGEVLEHLYTIDLKQVSDFRMSKGLLDELIKGYSFRFIYNSFPHAFKNCVMKKKALAVIAQEAGA